MTLYSEPIKIPLEEQNILILKCINSLKLHVLTHQASNPRFQGISSQLWLQHVLNTPRKKNAEGIILRYTSKPETGLFTS